MNSLASMCRRVVQIDVTTSEVHVEMSQYVKRELHSLVNYLHSSLVDEELTSTISRHFTKRVGSLMLNDGLMFFGLLEHAACACHPLHSARALQEVHLDPKAGLSLLPRCKVEQEIRFQI